MADLVRELGALDFGAGLAESLANIGRIVGQRKRQEEADKLAKGVIASIDIGNPETLQDPTLYSALSRMNQTPEGQAAISTVSSILGLEKGALTEQRASKEFGLRQEESALRKTESERNAYTVEGNQKTGYFVFKKTPAGIEKVSDKPVVPAAPDQTNVQLVPRVIKTERVTVGHNVQDVMTIGYWNVEKNEWMKDKEGNIIEAPTKEINLAPAGSRSYGDEDITQAFPNMTLPVVIAPQSASEKVGRIMEKTPQARTTMKEFATNLDIAKRGLESQLKPWIKNKELKINLDALIGDDDEAAQVARDDIIKSLEKIEGRYGPERADFVSNIIERWVRAVADQRILGSLNVWPKPGITSEQESAPASSVYIEIRRNPNTGERVGFNPSTNKWETIK